MKQIKTQVIAPSVLAADWSHLADEVTRAEAAGADWLHLDVMDGQFVENVSFGPQFVSAVRKHTPMFLDTHLMMHRPDHYIDQFVRAGSNRLTIHVEAAFESSLPEALKRIREAGVSVGLAVNPSTPFALAAPYLHLVDLFLVMTVVPGFGGQKFIMETMDTLRTATNWRETHGLDYHLQVDGGIYGDTAVIAMEHGANVLVVGTYAFGAADMKSAILRLRETEV